MKVPFLLLIIFQISTLNLLAQANSIDSLSTEVPYYYNTKPSGFFDGEYFGLHGYFITSGEIYSVDKHFFADLLNDPATPYVELEEVGYLGWMGMTRNSLFFSLSYATTNSSLKKNDSLSTES
jgi:hypothetical protein